MGKVKIRGLPLHSCSLNNEKENGMKQELIKDIIQGMLSFLNNAQCEKLQEVLQYNLAKYEVTESESKRVTWNRIL